MDKTLISGLKREDFQATIQGKQTDLFTPVQKTERSRLYKAVDALNARYGKGKVFSAAEGIGPRSWQMKRSKLSKRPTTRWDELMTVR